MKNYSKILITTLIQTIICVFLSYIGAIFIGDFQWSSKTIVELLTTFAYTYLITLILNFVVVLCFNRYKHSLRYFLLPLIFGISLILCLIVPNFHGVYYTCIFTAIYIIIANCGFVFLSSKKLADYISVPIAILVAAAATIIFNEVKDYYLNILITSEGDIYSKWYDSVENLFIYYYLNAIILNLLIWSKIRRIYIYNYINDCNNTNANNYIS